MHRHLPRAAAVTLLCTIAAAPLAAQSNTGGAGGPGTADAHWNVAWSPVAGSNGTASGSGSAYQVQSPPGAWANTSPNSFWVSTNSTASLANGTGDNADRYGYQYSTSWAGSSAAQLQMTVWTDNFFHSFTFNGVTTTVSPASPPGDFSQPAPRVFYLTPNASGTNSLMLSTTGDGQTDAVNVAFVTATPEPSSMALLGTGLVGLVPMVRRRRK